MGRKVFVSYKYADTLVKDLGVYEKNEWGQIEKSYTYTADNQISSCKYQDEELPEDIYYTYSEDTNDF